MSRRAATVLIFGICMLIIATGLGAVAFVLLGGSYSFWLGGTITGILGLLWLAAWAVYHLWG
jgi:hypothetical protein